MSCLLYPARKMVSFPTRTSQVCGSPASLTGVAFLCTVSSISLRACETEADDGPEISTRRAEEGPEPGGTKTNREEGN